MIRKALIEKLFESFSIQRWNDKIRPVQLTEMDKNAHKMVIAYCLAKYEIDAGRPVNWTNIIKGGVFEHLRRIILSDIKSPVHRKIKSHYPEVFRDLNQWIFSQLEQIIESQILRDELKEYLLGENFIDEQSGRILSAAHIYSSYWEFNIIKQANPNGYQIQEIDRLLLKDLEEYLDLSGLRKILTKQKISDFIDIVGHLRFQVRWGQTPRVPATSVLGHSLFVAIMMFFFGYELKFCETRLFNNFFGALFHDLPESVTRDIISPVKTSVANMPDAIRDIEKELVEKEIHPLIEEGWLKEFKYFTEDEFSSKIMVDSQIINKSSAEINSGFNRDVYSPIDGEIIKVADHLAAFVEAYEGLKNGFNNPHLENGKHTFATTYDQKTIADLNIGSIYADFK